MTDTTGLHNYKKNIYFWGSLTVIFFLIIFIYREGLASLVRQWEDKPEYSHGYLIPVISIFLVWQRYGELTNIGIKGSWYGTLIFFLALLMLVLGRFSFEYLEYYSLIILLTGLCLSLFGWKGLRILWAPIVCLFFMIPLPDWLYADLSSHLQLISSRLGVWIIRLFNISVLLEGNVIDLGVYKLQVVEACSGLRYLFPLTSVSFLCAYFFNTGIILRLVIFLSSIPIAILMNGFRVGITGVLVEYYGISAAEGFFHDFEGWIIFLACTVLLLGEMWIIAKLGRLGSFRELFVVWIPQYRGQGKLTGYGKLPLPYKVSGIMVLLTSIVLSPVSVEYIRSQLPKEVIPSRLEFSQFPMEIADWSGKRSSLGGIALELLKPTDSLVANYENSNQKWVNLYIGYWDAYRKGAAPHSPKICIPGAGWEIEKIAPVTIDGVSLNGKTLVANRIQIERGEQKQLVYYWYQQRGRLIRTEDSVRVYRYLDWFTKRRSDGALVRLVTSIQKGESWKSGDDRLVEFARNIQSELVKYIPD